MWIKLTSEDDTSILINTDKLEAIIPNENNRLTNLALNGTNEAYYVRESVDEIYKLINPSKNWN